MRDQVILARNALKNDIPLFTLIGKDKFALQTLEYYHSLAKEECSPEFLKDFHENVVDNFKVYQQENKSEIKLPDLTPSEKEAFYILQEKEFANFPSQIKDFKQHLKEYGFSQINENTLSHGKYIILNEKEWNGITAKNGDYDFAINHNKEKKQINYFLFSNDSNYPERIGDYDSLKACFFDVMVKHPLQEEKKILLL